MLRTQEGTKASGQSALGRQLEKHLVCSQGAFEGDLWKRAVALVARSPGRA